MVKTDREYLIDAKQLISDSKNWTQNVFGRANGKEINVKNLHKEADCWCAIGVLYKVTNNNLDIVSHLAHILAVQVKKFDLISIADVNDFLGHEAVLKLYDFAIESIVQ